MRQLCTPASIHPLSHHLRGRCVHVSQMYTPLTVQPLPPPPLMALFAASFLCLWFPLRRSREEKAVNLRVPLAPGSRSLPSSAPAAKAPVQPQVTAVGGQTRLPRPVNLSTLSLSLVCFLSCWHALGSSTTRSVENSFLQDLTVRFKEVVWS